MFLYFIDTYNSRIFIENMLEKSSNNIELSKELLLTYRELLNKQAELEMQLLKNNESLGLENIKADIERLKIYHKDN